MIVDTINPVKKAAMKSFKKPASQKGKLGIKQAAALQKATGISEMSATEQLEKYKSCVKT